MSDRNGRPTDRPDAETDTETDPETDEDAPTDRSQRPLDRRRLLSAGGAATATLLAGCAGLVPKGGPFSGPNESWDDTATPTAAGDDEPSETPTPAGTPTPDTDVVGLVLDEDGEAYQFIVTLRVPAEGGGADWWQVETLDGTKLGRREFDEPRTDEFTTSKTIDVEESAAVVVRGHDAEEGYGGQALLLDVESGSIDVARQGDEPESFEDYTF